MLRIACQNLYFIQSCDYKLKPIIFSLFLNVTLIENLKSMKIQDFDNYP